MLIQRRLAAMPGTRPKLERAVNGRPLMLSGYASVFFREGDPGTEFVLAEYGDEKIVEHIMEGAFDNVLREKADVCALFNHDPNFILGRTSSETCRLSVDKVGLRYEIDLPADSPLVTHVASAVARRDVTGSSFAFVPRAMTWRELDGGRVVVCEVDDLDLRDVSPVCYPAYTSTTAEGRSEREGRRALVNRIRAGLRRRGIPYTPPSR